MSKLRTQFAESTQAEKSASSKQMFERLNTCPTRVTRLGELSPIGWFISLGSFFNYNSSPKVWDTLFHGRNYSLILTKNGLGYVHFGQLFPWSNCDKKLVGLSFGRLFHQLTRSPCAQLIFCDSVKLFATFMKNRNQCFSAIDVSIGGNKRSHVVQKYIFCW
jgi:hypothetical protein